MKSPLITLAIGLVAGPLIASSAGWMVWSKVAKAQVRASVVEQGASYCAARVRSENSKTGALNYDERSALAGKWAMLPGNTEVDADIADSCAFKLAD
ncbi:MAG: hypothetical protein ACKVSF_07710 [Alphaproteobacteria bacterium]